MAPDYYFVQPQFGYNETEWIKIKIATPFCPSFLGLFSQLYSSHWFCTRFPTLDLSWTVDPYCPLLLPVTGLNVYTYSLILNYLHPCGDIFCPIVCFCFLCNFFHLVFSDDDFIESKLVETIRPILGTHSTDSEVYQEKSPRSTKAVIVIQMGYLPPR